MEPLTIGIIVCVIIAIILVVYFITKKPPVEQSLLDKTLKAFKIGIESKSGEHFSTDIVFNTADDIKNNFMVFLGYLFPKMNVDNINTLLTKYGSKKTMQEILTDKKDKIKLDDFTKNYMIMYYYGYMFDETNDKTIIDNVYILTTIIVTMFKYTIKLDEIIKELPQAYKNLLYVEASISDDYKTSNWVTIYIRTNHNKDIKIEDAYNLQKEPDSSCYQDKLCKISQNILDYVNSQKKYNQSNMVILKKLFDLSMVLYLLKLNDSDLTKIHTDFDLLSTKSSLLSGTQTSLDGMKTIYDGFSDDKKSYIQTEYNAFVTAGNALINLINSGDTDTSTLNTTFTNSKDALATKQNSGEFQQMA